MRVTRRQVLAGLGASVGAAAIGCGSDGSAGGTPDASGDPDSRVPDPDAAPPDAARSCSDNGGLSASELLAGIDTIVVLCMENRSFDHYLGALRLVEGRADIDGLTGSETNLDPDGAAVPVHLLEDFTPADPPHGWDACHEQWNDGALDGFVRAHAGADQADAMGYHVRSQLPITYALADAGALCERWFSSCLGPTWPNRFYLHGATSKGIKSNLPALGFASIFDRLDDAGIASANYYHDVAWASGGYGKVSGLRTIDRFFEDAEAGTLPPFSIVDPQFFGGGANDDHPDHDLQLGQALIGAVVAALGASPQWSRCLFVLTYDEHGGFYDHVAPPETIDDDDEFRRLGVRVPGIVIGPTVRRGCVISTVLEHSSVVATASAKWELPPLNSRAATVADLSVCIDPRRVDDPLPPPVLPKLRISRRRVLARPARPSHPELAEAIARRELPAGLDRRGESDAITMRVLERAAKLGVVELVD